MQDDIKLPDPDDAVAHMFPSDLAKFKKTERVRYAYPVPVSSPKERSIPLYTADQVRAAVLADREGRQQWQPIETAPRDGSTILLRGKGDHRIADGYWLQAAYNGNGAWVWPYVHSEPMKWMPVPADAQRAKGE